MTKAAPAQKLALTAPQTIPLDKLSIHDGNVRQIKAGISIENLAADIARRGLLQSLSVRPLIDDAGAETGRYGVQAGGRRLRALQMLVKQKKLAKNAPVPCIVRSEGFVEADSLAENTEREALHPLDQFRAFAALRDKGQGEETIAAAFGVTPAVVKQRLRLANASSILLKAYEDDELTLDQLMAFCLVEDRKRQEEVFAALGSNWNKGPDLIRRMLTEKTVRADDRRALFVGAGATKKRAASSSAICSTKTKAAGCKTYRSLKASSAKNSPWKLRLSRPKVGAGSKRRSIFPGTINAVIAR